MSSLKKAGLIGYGKMGRDIFDSVHSKMPDTEFVILVRHDAETESEKIAKSLAKALKRKKISEENFEKLSANFRFTDDLNEFSDCDLIIESVSEELSVKQDLFKKLDSIAGSECVFATNTSSLRISDIFSVCTPSRKTMGLHFFYPVKLSSYIELNNCEDRKYADVISSVTGKNTVSFRDSYCFYLNQFISFCISHAMILADKYKMSIRQSTELLGELFPMHSLFGMADSIGLGLLTSGNTEYNVARIKPVLDFGRSRMHEYMDDGCSPLTGMFLDYIAEKEKDTVSEETDREKFYKDMVSAMINEAVTAASETEPAVAEAVYDAVGLSDTFESFYSKYGYETISESLCSAGEFTGFDTYRPAEEAVFRKILKLQ